MLKKVALLMRLAVGVGLVLTAFPSSFFLFPDRAVLAKVVADEAPSAVSSETPAAFAQTTSVTHTIYLQSREFVPVEPDVQALQRLAVAGRDRVHVLLQLDFIPRQAAKAEFEARGVKLLAYVPDYAWIASVPAVSPAAVLQLPGVTWAGELTVDDKLDPITAKDVWGTHNLAPDGTVAVYVAMHADESLDAGRKLVAAVGGRVTGEVAGINLLVVEMPRANVRALASDDAVQWIEQAAPPLEEGNDGIRPQIGVNVVNASPYSLDGTGIDVLVYDGGQAGSHVDFGSRLVIGAGDTSGVSEHSTHVAGTVGGSGANSAAQGGSSLQWRGMAPAVDIISYGYEWDGSGMLFYDNPGDIEVDWARAQNWYGADLGTASLTSNIYMNYSPSLCDRMGNYGTTAVLVDQMARGGNSTVGIGDKYISLWCNGNERGKASSCDTYRTISPPASAKNPIHVGASNTNNNSMTTFSSWGPTDDGRIKPTIVAGGCQSSGDYGITSTDNNPANDYTTMCGCSMATPAVAGGIALMLQQYRDIYNTTGNFWPSTAKAILIHTADDFGNPGPDYQWGYGQVDIHAAVDLISRKAFRQETIASGETDVYYFIVPDDDADAMVTLVWDDFEATFNANPTLINNLDLELVAPSGTIWRPWVLNPASPGDNATRGVDSINNQEQVQVPTPEVGTWLVRVKSTTVPQGPQDYTLVCEGCKPLDLGVCQDKVDGSTMLREGVLSEESLSEGMDMVPSVDQLALGGLDEEDALAALSPEPPSAGELWQRSLEAVPFEEDDPSMERQVAVQRSWAAFEAAREIGSAAILAIADTLHGEVRDVVMDEIVDAQEQMAALAPPPPDRAPLSEGEERAALEAVRILEAKNRVIALRGPDVSGEGEGSVEPVFVPQAIAAPAADLTVGNGCTYATIAAAIAAANPGDHLLLEGGRTFVENVTIPFTLTVQGGYDGCDSGSAARTTLDGNASGPVVTVNRAIEVSLENLNITNGSTGSEGGGIRFALGDGTGSLHLAHIDIYANQGQWGGGLWVGPDAEVTGEYVEIYNNTATAYGGGVRLYGGRLTLSNSDIYGNSAPYGGGIYAALQNGYAPVINLPSWADLYQNTATTGDGMGGGIYLREGTISLADCSDVYDNEALRGGGVYMITGTLTIGGSCSEIDSNVATHDGGGIYAQDSTINLDDDAELYYNTATTGNGGGAYLDNSDLWGDKAIIWYNTTGGYGGGLYASNGSFVDMDIDNYTCVSVRCSRLYRNTATYEYGGGIYSVDSSIDLRNTFVELNTAYLGGGIYAYDSTLYLYNDVFAGNNATGTAGDGIRLYTDSTLNGTNNTFAYNDVNFTSTGRAIDIVNADLTLTSSIIWGHTSSIGETGHNVTYSDIQGGYAGDGNLALNPLFVSTASRDYHLQETSPLIDRCLSGVSPDFENETRPIVRHTAAAPYDMGADEVSGVARVGLNGGTCQYSTIQQAINAAEDGDAVQVAEGVYFENLTVFNKDITIAGGYDSTCTVTGTTTTRVDGSASSSRVMYVYNSPLTLRDIELAWGSGSGAGLYATSNSHVILDNADFIDNHGTYGGGLYVSGSSIITATNGATISGNTASVAGGGGYVSGQFFADGETSDVYNNCAANGGGFHVPGGDLYLEEADVLSNQAAAADGKGGGIYVTNGGNVHLNNNVAVGTSLFAASQIAYDGAGIYADNSTVSLDDVNLGYNLATRYGGGLYLGNNSTLQAADTELGHAMWFFVLLQFGNSANYGGGLYADSSTVDFSGNIATNVANYSGGGVYATNSTLNLTDATVGLVGDALGNRLGTNGHAGAGLYLANGSSGALSNTVLVSNTFQTTGYTYGGGAYVTGNSTLTLQNSRVEQHDALSTDDGRGAGLYVNGSTVTLDNSQVLSNTAGTVGGAVRMLGTSTLNVLNDSQIRNNESLNGEGGAIAAAGTPDINIENAVLLDNTAGTDGGAIYLSGGTLDFTGGWTLRENTAGGNGGAIAVAGTADARFTANSYSLVYYNRALGGHGGMVYLGNNTTAELYAVVGPLMYVYANRAENGGALYADNGGYFDIYGRVNFERNRADNGGAIYLSNSSRVWLDDYSTTAPELWDNWADNGSGGAIYAQDSPRVECDGAILGRTGNDDGNHASQNGGAVYLSGSTFDAENCHFVANEAAGDGGAIAAYTSTMNLYASFGSLMRMSASEREPYARLTPAAITATPCNPSLGSCSAFYGNAADTDMTDDDYGGAIYINASTLQMNHTVLHNNSAWRGGGIYQEGVGASSSQVSNSLFYSNTVRSTTGAAIRVVSGNFTSTHVTLANHPGSAPAYSAGSGTNEVRNSIAWGNAAGGFQGTYVITDCNIDQSANVGINVDPHFIAPGVGEDYHLFGDSPAIDACATGLSPDLDNVLRPAVLAYDMGAYEYPYGLTFVPDRSGMGYPAQDTLYTHTLTNTGGTVDTFTLSGLSNHGWSLSLPPSVTLNAGQATPVEVVVHVPAGILSDTVDTAIITATSDADTTLSAFVVDTTTIGFAPDALFTPDYTRLGAGESDSFLNTHTLTNTGNAQDTFNLAFTSSRGWGSLLTSSPIILNPNQSASVLVSIQVPVGGEGLSDLSVVTATSTGGAGPVLVRDITSAFTPGGAFTPDHEQTVVHDTVLTLTHTLTNTGNSTDTFHMTALSTLGWGTLVDTGPFTLIPDEAQSVRVRVTVPPGTGGMTDTTWVTATSAAGADPVSSRDTTAVFMPGMAFAPDYVQTMPTNSAMTYTHRLTNTGDADDIFDVGLASSSEGWATLVDTGPFALSSGAAADVRVRIESPDGSGGVTDVSVVTATSRAGSLSGLSATVTDTTTAILVYGVAFTPDHAQSLDPGDTFTYTHWLTNTGSGTDKFHLNFNSSRGWATLLDPGPFKLVAGDAVSVHVRVDVPLSSGGLVDIATILAYSELSPTVTATVTDTTTSMYHPGTTLIPDYDQSVSPGTALTYTHWLTNSGNGSDQFVLDFASSQGWATLFEAGPFNLDAGEGVTLNVRVAVPPGSGGVVDTSLLTATSQTGGLSALATDTTTAIHTPGVDLVPDYAQSVVPDETFIYVHTLGNTGDGFDTFSVTMTSSAGWSTLLDPGPFALGAGEAAEVRVSVLVPSGLISGTASDIAVVTATSYANPAVQDTATDTTTVGYAPSALFERNNLTVGALPNETFVYTHWLTNTGNHTDTFETAFDSIAGWGTLLDPGPFDLGLGESATVRVQVDVPPDGNGKFDTSVVTVTSQGGVGPLMVWDVTAAFTPGVALAPDFTQTVNPGDVVTLTHTLTNTGTSTDTIRLVHNTTQGWSALLDPGPYTLLSGESVTARVVVTVPLGSGGLVDVTTLDAITLDGWGPSARVTDTTDVIYVPGITLEPDYVDAAPAGSSIIYTHLLTNTGNGPDTFSVTLHSSLGWGALLDPGPFDLAADGSTEVRVEVTVPTDTLVSEVDTTIITATSLVGGLSDQATDTTSVVCEPLVGANFTFVPSLVQTSQPVMFTGAVAGGSLPISYLWNFGDNSSEQSGNPVTHVFATENTFTVWMTATNTCPSVVTATRQIVAMAYPDITVTPSFMTALLQPDTTVTQTLTLDNVGDADLAWSLVETPTVGWLSETPVSGTVVSSGSAPVSVAYDAGGLVDGVYTTTLHLVSNDPDEVLTIVLVTLTVTTGMPDITVSPLTLAATLQPDGVVTQMLTLGNVGDVDLTWNLTEVIAATWLSELPTGGVILPAGSAPVDVAFNATGLVSGTFTSTLRIASNDPDEAVVDVLVTLTIGGDTYIYLPLVMRNH